ncbi:hypothetical protein J2S17_002588 [Cytobacillus purgationiresistens]|uniref:Uncharacterized protein n=2 Tax=Cytobacillus purgationiresistens TaxID=863449 RepID=A0ABU0AHF9_9BACI|nr:hypothetical protein [Cytobacillus purgationiresistens]
MDRDSIAEIHFADNKRPNYSANNVLLRLWRDGHIQRSKAFVPFLYFGAETQIKKNSAKIGHFLAILDVYKELRMLGATRTFLVEPKYGRKGTVEPDVYCQYRKTGFFVEVQRTLYSDRQMAEKLGRYVDFYRAGIMPKPFPHVLILSERPYAINAADYPFRIFQAQSFTAFVQSLKKEKPPEAKPITMTDGIRMVLK